MFSGEENSDFLPMRIFNCIQSQDNDKSKFCQQRHFLKRSTWLLRHTHELSLSNFASNTANNRQPDALELSKPFIYSIFIQLNNAYLDERL